MSFLHTQTHQYFHMFQDLQSGEWNHSVEEFVEDMCIWFVEVGFENLVGEFQKVQ